MRGKIHNTASALAAIPSGLAVGLTYGPGPGVLTALGCLTGIAVGPDNDMLTITTYEWAIIKRTLGLGYIWLGYWGPYAAIFKHRSFWSHAPVISTAIRILYILPLLYILSAVLRQSLGHFMWNTFWWVGIGLLISDTLHWIMDHVPG